LHVANLNGQKLGNEIVENYSAMAIPAMTAKKMIRTYKPSITMVKMPT
jgi:hypothetical protein